MEKLSDLFGFFASGIGVGVLLSSFFALVGFFVALFKRVMSAE